MTSGEAIQALAEWVTEKLPQLAFIYDHAVLAKPEGLPDCVVELRRTGISPPNDTRFSFWDIQARAVYFVEADLSFMVDNGDTEAAAMELREFEQTLLVGVTQEPTLGSRVPFASPQVDFDFTAPFVEWSDGTKGRVMTMTIAVGDLVEAQD